MMMGVEAPAPGSSVFQAMFSVALHFVGRSLSGLVPRPEGPRNCGQSAPEGLTTETQRHREEKKAKARFISPLLLVFSVPLCLCGSTSSSQPGELLQQVPVF